jgi:hypothetical protein
MTKGNQSFARAGHCCLPLGEPFEIASSPSAPRNDRRGKAFRSSDSLWGFAMDITSFPV